MKVHAGVDAGTGYIHTIEGTAANVHDSTEAIKLIREDDHVLFGCANLLMCIRAGRTEQFRNKQVAPIAG